MSIDKKTETMNNQKKISIEELENHIVALGLTPIELKLTKGRIRSFIAEKSTLMYIFNQAGECFRMLNVKSNIEKVTDMVNTDATDTDIVQREKHLDYVCRC